MTRLALLLFSLSALCFIPAASAQPTLAALKDKNRVLLLFAPSDKDPRYLQQLQLLAGHDAALRERDLVVLPALSASGPEVTPQTLRILTGPQLPPEEQLAARHRFRIRPDAFAVILIGKDGGEKLRSTSPIPLDRLESTIDAMPMRKDEMRNRH